MEKHSKFKPQTRQKDPIRRRGFLKGATLLGLGALGVGTVTSNASPIKNADENSNLGAILNKKRSLRN